MPPCIPRDDCAITIFLGSCQQKCRNDSSMVKFKVTISIGILWPLQNQFWALHWIYHRGKDCNWIFFAFKNSFPFIWASSNWNQFEVFLFSISSLHLIRAIVQWQTMCNAFTSPLLTWAQGEVCSERFGETRNYQQEIKKSDWYSMMR